MKPKNGLTMQNVSANIPKADEIAAMADREENIARFFTNKGTMKYPAQSVHKNLDMTGYSSR